MKSKLEQVHAELLSAIDDLEALTAAAQPDANRLSNVRWKVSKASGRRFRFLEEHVYPQVRLVDESLAQRIRQLRDEGAELRAKSTGHVGSWPIAEVLNNWAGYCEASRDMRRAMRLRIERELNLVAAMETAIGGECTTAPLLGSAHPILEATPSTARMPSHLDLR